MKRSWGRSEDPETAVGKILEGADKAFIELGVSKAGMAEVAEFAGCSRGTLYRYFANRHELHLAYVRRKAVEIHQRVQESVGAIADPRERLVEYVLRAVAEVRGDPGAAAWFVSGVSGMAARMSRSIEVVESFAAGIAPELPQPTTDPDPTLRVRWLVRIIVSLLADPEASPAHERLLVERFAVPACLADLS